MSYIQDVIAEVSRRNVGEQEFLQAIEEVFQSLEPVIEQHPEFVRANLLARMAEPERQIIFRVPWVDDQGQVQVNRGYRVQYNGAIGPYKGGIRFHKSVNLGIIKFLGFEQTFKNALTGLPLGGGKGGSDFDPNGRSDGEIMRFCQSFMTELYRHIGPDVDVPAGDIGVAAREVGYLYGQYRRIRGAFENGVLTGKGLSYGGSLIRPEATGYGVIYFVREMLAEHGETIEGKRIAISGFGNVAWGTVVKAAELGARVITISGPDGYVLDEEGISGDKIKTMLELRASGRDIVQPYAEKHGVPFFAGERPWGVKADIMIPCATQNEIQLEHAERIVANGVRYVCEAANMPCSNEAVAHLQAHDVVVGPAKAANAGGVATSALEMSQNSMRLSWSAEEVDQRLQAIMHQIHANAKQAAARYGYGYNLVAGANIAGFARVAEAMMAQGDY